MFKAQSVKLYKRLSAAKPFFLICGPCMIESEKSTLVVAERLNDVRKRLNIPVIFKASYDKANRTSGSSPRGVGIKDGPRILKYVKDNFEFDGITTDVHDVHSVADVAEVADILQIPAFLCRQTDLIVQSGNTGRIVNIKKGQFASANTMLCAQDKILRHGCMCNGSRNSDGDFDFGLMLTERGTTFGYDDLIVDFRNLERMRTKNNLVIQDVSHANQNKQGNEFDRDGVAVTGGNKNFIPAIGRAAAAVGVDGIFIETHINSSMALSDKETQIDVGDLEELVVELIEIANVSRGGRR